MKWPAVPNLLALPTCQEYSQGSNRTTRTIQFSDFKSNNITRCNFLIQPPEVKSNAFYPPMALLEKLPSSTRGLRKEYFLSLLGWILIASMISCNVMTMLARRRKVTRAVSPSDSADPLVARSRYALVGTSEREEKPEQELHWCAHLSYHIYCISICFLALYTDAVSTILGLDWELWVLWLSGILFVQHSTLLVRLLNLSEGYRPPSCWETTKGVLFPVSPVIGELLDTKQDYLFIALCATKGAYIIGSLSILCLLGSNLLLRRMEGGATFLLESYLPLWRLREHEKGAPEAPADGQDLEASSSNSCACSCNCNAPSCESLQSCACVDASLKERLRMMVINLLEEQTREQKVAISVTEDSPQACLKLCFVAIYGGTFWVLFTLVISIAKTVVPLLARPIVLQLQGRYKDSWTFTKYLLDGKVMVYSRVFGIASSLTVQAQLEKIDLLLKLGSAAEAERLATQVHQACLASLPQEEPSTLSAALRVLRAKLEVGQFKEAVEVGEPLVESSKRALGPQHPDTLTAMGSLAISYRELGLKEAAKALEEQVLEARRQDLGPQHPDTLTAMGNLALSYLELGLLQEAKALEEQVLEARRQALGPRHPDTLQTINNLAASYWELGLKEEAKALMEQVLEARRQVLGPQHPLTLRAKGNLAISYKELGLAEEAKALEEQVLEAMCEVLGPQHPDTLQTMGNLAVCNKELGLTEEAKALEEQVLEAQRQVLGPQHPDTLTTMGNLAVSYKELGLKEEAKALEEQVLEAQRQVLGPQHPDTLTTMGNLAVSYWELGLKEEAKALVEQVLEARRQVLGPQHPDTIKAMRGLAIMCRQLGLEDRAAALDHEADEQEAS